MNSHTARTPRAAFAALGLLMLLAGPVVAAPEGDGGMNSAARVEPAAPVTGSPQDAEPQPLRRKHNSTSQATKPTTQKSTATAARPSASGFDPTRVAISLGVVLGLILLLRLGGKKFFGVSAASRATRAVQVLSRSPLSPRQQLILIRVGRRLIVCADGGGQVTTLSEITDPDEVASLIGQIQDDHGDRAVKTFGSLFTKSRGSYEDADDEDASSTAPLPIRGRTSAAADEDENDPAVASTRQELSGLMDKVRLLSRQFKS